MDLLDGTARIDRIEDYRRLPGGGAQYTVRGRIYGRVACLRDGGVVSGSAVPTERQSTRQVGEGRTRIVGIASSTGVDSWGTEMSLLALEGMAAQFKAGTPVENRGVPYAPTHGEREWHQTVGNTVDAIVRGVAAVLDAHDEEEPQYVLDVWSDIKTSHARGMELIAALNEGDPIGQSIGGWFLRLIVTEDEHGWVDRVIVDEVELDHLAATRTPANSDSTGLMVARDALAAAIGEVRTKPVGDPEMRHIFAIGGTDNTVIMQFLRPGVEADDVDPSEVVEGAEPVVVGGERSTAVPTTREEPTTRTVVAFQELAKSPDDEAWTWTSDVQDGVLFPEGLDEAADWARYRTVHGWYDASEPEDRASYALPIARDFDGTLRYVLGAVEHAVASVNAGEGGVPEDDRREVFDQLAKVLAMYDVNAPEFIDAPERSTPAPAAALIDEVARAQAEVAAALANGAQPSVPPASQPAVRSTLPGSDATPAASVAPQPSEANSAEDHTQEVEINMDPKELAALVGEAVRTQVEPLTQRIAALETDPAVVPAAVIPPPAVVPPAARRTDAEFEAAVAARTTELSTQIAGLETEAEGRTNMVDRLLERSAGRGPARLVTADRDAVIDAALDIRDNGDFSALITLTKAEGSARRIVRVSESNTAVAFARDHERLCMENPATTRNLTPQDLKAALTPLFRAALEDGIIHEPVRAANFL